MNPIETLFPGYFALVMATGIIAIAAKQHDIGWLAAVLYIAAGVALAVLVVVLLVRIVVFTGAFVADLTSHTKGFGFLTLVAAINVLGSASGVIHGWWTAALVLWWCSLPIYAVLVYSTLISDVLRHVKPGLGAGINGSWFLLTVSTESIAVLGALLLGRDPNDLLAFVCVAAFTLGLTLYLIVMTLVFLRWTFHALEPAEADPPAWIAAGAVAITVLAGSNLLAAGSTSPRIDRLAPFIEGFVTLAWATATFWFPLMVAIGVWRHLVCHVSLRYHPSYWSLVFPLGMYSAATYQMRASLQLDYFAWLPTFTLGIALSAWTATAAGLAWHGTGAARRRRALIST